MKLLLFVVVAGSLLATTPAWGEGNPNPWPVLVIRNSTVDEAPAGACVFPAGIDPQTELQCYDRKLAAGNYGFLSVHAGHLDNGFTGLPFGIHASGSPVTYVEFVACPGFAVGPSQAGMPSAILVTSTVGCRQERDAVGYLKYKCLNTSVTYFNIVGNADLGHYKVVNCDYTFDENTEIKTGAQWGGNESTLFCPGVGVGIEATTWGQLKAIFR